MIQGTSSHVGKSVIVAGLCRLFSDMGLLVAPFKAQNMALNSYVTLTGEEIGRAQAFQAEAARIEPTAEMNPVLLKPTGDSVSQVILKGRVHSTQSAREYHAFKPTARATVTDCFNRLKEQYDVIVIEGAGSPAEVNLREGDIANMGMAEIADCAVLLVGDIDRGGVFASLVGTLALLTPEENRRIKGFIINKFRGDVTLLTPGLDDLLERTGTKTLGVVPYIQEIRLPDEDSVALDDRIKNSPNKERFVGNSNDVRGISIKIIRLPRISNFTDFDPLIASPGVDVDFIEHAEEVDGADLLILPGTKNTLGDMAWLCERGFDKKIVGFHAKGGLIVGICGGFQILGHKIEDPDSVESSTTSADSAGSTGPRAGLGLLDITTSIESEKATYRVEATVLNPFSTDKTEFQIEGYEVHMGRSCAFSSSRSKGPVSEKEREFGRISTRNRAQTEILDGAVSTDGRVWGSYIHGLFDSDVFRASVIESVREASGKFRNKTETEEKGLFEFSKERDRAFDSLAKVLKESLDMEAILDIIGLKSDGHYSNDFNSKERGTERKNLNSNLVRG
ncbi:MAG: cobyric acid synthase [Proteobacteria bacterium]|nr:cobyric acid synthase [Pseudomonadota bacterium]